MALAKITLFGMYHYLQLNNQDLFAGFSTPTGIDRQKAIDTILLRGAEFEVLYADSDAFVRFIGIWSDKVQHTLERWAKALAIDYNPLENYDRMEDWMDAKNRQEQSSRENSGFGWNGGYTEDGSTSTNDVAAFDSSTYSPKDQTNVTGGSESQSATQNMNNESAKSSGSDDAVHSGRIHGNIGVTTSQRMLQEEWEVAKLNVYEEIADLFCSEFCIYTY